MRSALLLLALALVLAPACQLDTRPFVPPPAQGGSGADEEDAGAPEVEARAEALTFSGCRLTSAVRGGCTANMATNALAVCVHAAAGEADADPPRDSYGIGVVNGGALAWPVSGWQGGFSYWLRASPIPVTSCSGGANGVQSVQYPIYLCDVDQDSRCASPNGAKQPQGYFVEKRTELTIYCTGPHTGERVPNSRVFVNKGAVSRPAIWWNITPEASSKVCPCVNNSCTN